MTQIGRISGPLLTANLERQGTVQPASQANLSFRNDNDSNVLLKIDVNNGRIGVDIDAPVNELQISNTLRTINLLDNTAGIANYTISNNNLVVDSGDIYLNAGEIIQLPTLETEQFYVSDNFISIKNANTDIDLDPNGTGAVEVKSNLNVFGNLHSNQNITLDGTITFGNAAAQDTVDFNSDVNSDIVPDQNETYNLGESIFKRWLTFYTELINGEAINAGSVSISGVNLSLRQGNIFYVATNGNNSNVGDHVQGPLATIEEALSRCDASTQGPVLIHVFPGTYAENLPLTLPPNVSITGHDIRNTIIVPAAGSESKDVFHLSDSSTVSNITIKDFYRDDINNTGYAFRFAPDAVITNRSPYIQNVSVITKEFVVVTYSENYSLAGEDWTDGFFYAQPNANIISLNTNLAQASFYNALELTTIGTVFRIVYNDDTVDILTQTNNSEYSGSQLNIPVTGFSDSTIKLIKSISWGQINTPQDNAGKGAWIDGSELNSSSIEASMLFHSCTFITPSADAISMTNGVRVEWLNSFTYFANRGLYAFNGLTGRTTYDGSTIKYGAEVRSIGSASVYGNYGAVADGADTLMYLIQHNFGYIGSGLDSSNDKSLAIQGNEVVELNSGKIHYVTTDHLGSFRVGDSFFVDFETGSTSVNVNTLTVDHLTGLVITTGNKSTTVDGAFIETGNLRVSSNLIESLSGNLDLAAASGKINLLDDTGITGNLTISGDLSFGGSLNISGNETTDSLSFNVEFEQDFNPNQHLTFDLGSFQKQWLIAHLDRIESGDFSVYDNIIQTNISNANLELRANGTGKILISDSATFSNALTVSGLTTISGGAVINDTTFTHTGNFVQTGSRIVTDNVSINQNINVGAAAQFENIRFDDNVITTTVSNSNLELRSNGVSVINIQENLEVINDLDADNIIAQTDASSTLNTNADNALIGNIEINDNYIQTVSGNSDLVLVSDKDIAVVNTDTVFDQNLTVNGASDFQGTLLTGTLIHNVNTSQTGNVLLSGDLSNGDLTINDNVILTTVGNNNLIFIADGNGEILIPSNDVEITNNLTINGSTTLQSISISGLIDHTGDRNQTGNYIQGGELSVDNIYVEDNFITTNSGDLILQASGNLSIPLNSVEITQNLIVLGNSFLANSIITGSLLHTGDRNQVGDYDIGGELTVDDIYVEDNFIVSTGLNQNLEIRADGNGIVLIDDNTEITNNLVVNGSSDIKDVSITGTLTQTGDRTQTGQYSQTGNLIVNSVNFAGDVKFTDISVFDNVITTTIGNNDLDLRASGSGQVLVQNTDLRVTNNLFAASIETTNINIAQDLILDELVIRDSNIEIAENFISTKLSNSDLELRATGDVNVLSNDTIIEQSLTVNGTTNLKNTNIDGLLLQTGNRTQTGNFNLTGNLSIGSLLTSQTFQFDDIRIRGNVLETTLNNSNLELRAIGTGNIYFNDSVRVNRNLETGTINLNTISVARDVALESIELSSDIQFFDNVITTTNSNSNLELRANGAGSVYLDDIEFDTSIIKTASTNIVLAPSQNVNVNSTGSLRIPRGTTLQERNVLGDIRFNTDDNLFEGTTNLERITFGGVYSQDRRSSVLAHPTNNIISLTVNTVNVGTVAASGLTIHALQVEDIFIDNNSIITNVSNSSLEFKPDGSGEIVLDNISFVDNFIKNDGSNIIFQNIGFGKVKFDGTKGIAVPYGTTAERPISPPQTGDTRWNTDTQLLETWDGNQYIAAGGIASAISREEFDDLLLEYTLIFG